MDNAVFLFSYLLPVLPTAVGMGIWLRDDPDYRDAPGMLGLCSFMGGFIWPLVLIALFGVWICTLFGEWVRNYKR